MRSDHTATEMAPPPAPPGRPLDNAGDGVSQKPVRGLARVVFCFAWLFGLDPFLTGAADNKPRSKRDRR
jgi:hypothetical protein